MYEVNAYDGDNQILQVSGVGSSSEASIIAMSLLGRTAETSGKVLSYYPEMVTTRVIEESGKTEFVTVYKKVDGKLVQFAKFFAEGA